MFDLTKKMTSRHSAKKPMYNPNTSMIKLKSSPQKPNQSMSNTMKVIRNKENKVMPEEIENLRDDY